VNNIPLCPFCDSGNYTSQGGTYGGAFSQSSYKCEGCNCLVQGLSQRAGRIYGFIQRAGLKTRGVGKEKIWLFPESWVDWVNKSLVVAWADRESRIKAHEDAEWAQWLAEVFYVRFPEMKGWEHPDRPGHSAFTDTTISYYDSPPEAQALLDDFFGGPNTVRRTGTYVPFPKELATPLYPPGLPNIPGVLVTYLNGDVWEQVDPDFSQTLPVPEHPAVVSDRDFFREVWWGVEAELGEPLPDPEDVENQYRGRAPWHQFTYHGAMFTVGWRRRVVSIRVEFPNLVPTGDIREKAFVDKTTYEAHGPFTTRTIDEYLTSFKDESPELLEHVREGLVRQHPDGLIREREGGYHDWRDEAEVILIHAWGKAKCIEYLASLCSMARDSQAAPVAQAAPETAASL
jgi:hypothetical protein